MQIEECIEGEPEISTVRVNPGETNETISGLPNENKVQGEGSVYYDIRFFAALPAEVGRIRLLINLEAQKDYYPGYQIPTRGDLLRGAYAVRAVGDRIFRKRIR